MLRFNCILFVSLFWAYSPNFSSFHKFKAELACCQVSAIYLVNCHFPFLGLWCFVARDRSDQNASFWLHFIPKTFLYNPSKFHSDPWRTGRTRMSNSSNARMQLFCILSVRIYLQLRSLFCFSCSLWFSCCYWLSILCLSFAMTLYQQRVLFGLWHLMANYWSSCA